MRAAIGPKSAKFINIFTSKNMQICMPVIRVPKHGEDNFQNAISKIVKFEF